MSHQKPQRAEPASGRREVFKPVALPALAAAVAAQSSTRRPAKRPARTHELPAILRDEVAYS